MSILSMFENHESMLEHKKIALGSLSESQAAPLGPFQTGLSPKTAKIYMTENITHLLVLITCSLWTRWRIGKVQ